jgi:hypothetical protein
MMVSFGKCTNAVPFHSLGEPHFSYRAWCEEITPTAGFS